MSELPFSPLPISTLGSCFREVMNSYKYYWFLAILDQALTTHTGIISLDHLLSSMISKVWYPSSYFQLSFGRLDRLGSVVKQISEEYGIPGDAKSKEVKIKIDKLLLSDFAYIDQIRNLMNYVPYRFLRPFFAQELRGCIDHQVNQKIRQLADDAFQDPKQPCLYRFIKEPRKAIEIHPEWLKYLKQHHSILSGFCYWHLVDFLQKNNPNVPNISSKLFEPQVRVLSSAKTFWSMVIRKIGYVKCIYSNSILMVHEISLDHFLPWRFVAHDLLWNIIPTPKEINSSKSDCLPDFDYYFDAFAQMQFDAIHSITGEKRSDALLEDHLIAFGASSVEELSKFTLSEFSAKLRTIIAPQFQIAANLGFRTGWRYSP